MTYTITIDETHQFIANGAELNDFINLHVALDDERAEEEFIEILDLLDNGSTMNVLSSNGLIDLDFVNVYVANAQRTSVTVGSDKKLFADFYIQAKTAPTDAETILGILEGTIKDAE